MSAQASAVRVILGHPGTQHSLQSVAALYEADLLQTFFTTLYFRKATIGQVANVLPAALRSRWVGAAKRRSLETLPDSMVQTAPLYECARIAAGALRLPPHVTRSVQTARNAAFDAALSRKVEAERPGAAYVFDTSGRETLRTCRKLGIAGILDQTIGHVASGKKILDEERELHPDFADSIDSIPQALVELCTEEALLADALLVGSAYAEQTLIEIGVQPERIRKIEYGANTTLFTPGPRVASRPFRFLFVGSVTQRKGIKYLLEAFSKLRLPNCELVVVGGIVGSGRGLAPYRNSFTYRGLLGHAELVAEYQQADVFMCPSLHEGATIAAFEALASGLPIIATPNAGTVVRDGVEGFLVPIRDTTILAEKMERLYRDAELRSSMSAAAVNRAAGFTWERYRLNLAAQVREVLELN